MNSFRAQEAAKKPEMSIIPFFPSPTAPRLAVLLKEGTS